MMNELIFIKAPRPEFVGKNTLVQCSVHMVLLAQTCISRQRST